MLYFLVFYFGCIMGSFLNVVALRLPREEGLNGRSHCAHCRHVLSWPDLFPLFSYLFLRGKCRYCKQPVSSRYFLFEIIVGFLFLLVYLQVLPHNAVGFLILAKEWVLVSALLVVFVIDLKHYLIFDSVLLAAGLPVLFLNVALDYLTRQAWWSLSSLSVGGLFAGGLFAGFFYLLWWFSKGRWIGFGDVKLMLLLGVALGWPNTAAAWLLAYFLGTAYALPLLVLGKKHLSSRLPFGCFLSPAALIAMLYGPALIRWYLAILGF